jgi:formylglycine-generating enzyme required for sulfatase activity
MHVADGNSVGVCLPRGYRHRSVLWGRRRFLPGADPAGRIFSQDELIWYTDNSNNDAYRDPRQGMANPFGLRECHGNVFEWCQDRLDETAYRRFHSGIDEAQALELSELLGSHEDKSDFGEYRLRRGGSFINDGCFQHKPPNRGTYQGARKRAPWWVTRSVGWAV